VIPFTASLNHSLAAVGASGGGGGGLHSKQLALLLYVSGILHWNLLR